MRDSIKYKMRTHDILSVKEHSNTDWLKIEIFRFQTHFIRFEQISIKFIFALRVQIGDTAFCSIHAIRFWLHKKIGSHHSGNTEIGNIHKFGNGWTIPLPRIQSMLIACVRDGTRCELYLCHTLLQRLNSALIKWWYLKEKDKLILNQMTFKYCATNESNKSSRVFQLLQMFLIGNDDCQLSNVNGKRNDEKKNIYSKQTFDRICSGTYAVYSRTSNIIIHHHLFTVYQNARNENLNKIQFKIDRVTWNLAQEDEKKWNLLSGLQHSQWRKYCLCLLHSVNFAHFYDSWFPMPFQTNVFDINGKSICMFIRPLSWGCLYIHLTLPLSSTE